MGEDNDLATELATDEGGFGLTSRTLGGLPIVNHVLDRLGLPALLDEALGEVDGRSTLTPAAAIRVVITNVVLGREPLYALVSGLPASTRRCWPWWSPRSLQ